MLLADTWLFGQLKGKTLEDSLKCEKDRDWMHWYVGTTSNKPEYAERDKSQKDSIKRHLRRAEGEVVGPSDVSSAMYIAGELKPLKERVDKLEIQMNGIHKNMNLKDPKGRVVPNAKETEEGEAWDE